MGRRANSEGTIYKRGDGTWCAAISISGRRKVAYAPTQAAARRKLADLVRQREQGLLVGTDRQTLGEYLGDWLQRSAKPRVRPGTYEGYRVLAERHIVPALGRVPLGRLTPQHVQGFLSDRLAAGLSPRTVQFIRAVLHMALEQAAKWGIVARNVVALVDAPRVRRSEPAVLSPEQVGTLLAAIRCDRLAALYVTTLALGLRQGEALGLAWVDVDLQAKTLRVRQALQRIGHGRSALGEPKTARARRTLALPDAVVAALREHHRRQAEERLRAGAAWQDTGLVFTTQIGTSLNGRNVTRYFQQALARAELPRLRFHDLRHSCASLLVALGLHPRIVMETLGHSNISMTMDTYSHVMPVLQREAAEKMDTLLRGALG